MEKKQLTRDEYKEKFLSGNPVEGECARVVISVKTKNKLRQLCTAPDGCRVRVATLLEKIIEEHCAIHAGTIEELYKNDIPVY